NSMDVAINGRGSCALPSSLGETGSSCNGQFMRDADGFIINNAKHQLLGQALDNNGAPAGPAGTPIQLTNDSSPPQKAENMTMTANMDSRAANKSTSPIDFSDPSTYNFVTSQTVYGDNGAPIAVNYYFRKIGDQTPGDATAVPPDPGMGGQWEVYMSADGNTNAASASLDTSTTPPTP